MEIDFVACGGVDEPAILFPQQPHNPTVIGHGVHFDGATPLAGVICELASRGVEGVPDRHMGVLMRVVRAAVMSDDDLAARDGEIDADLEQLA